MSVVQLREHQIYYQVDNPAAMQLPLVILNGIMMSTASWDVFVDTLAADRPLVRLDFVDQGQSSRAEQMDYDHHLQVEAVLALLDRLDYQRYQLYGISYGGQIALQVALAAPQRVAKLVVANAAANTTAWLRDIGRSWVKSARTYDAEHFYLTTIPYIYSNYFYNVQNDWMEARKSALLEVFNASFLDAMVRLINSSESYDIRHRLAEISCPALIIGCERDFITPSDEVRYLATGLSNAHYLEFARTGHASMYEKPVEFVTALLGFLQSDDRLSVL